MTGTVVIVGDAHLSEADPEAVGAFHRFVRAVPRPGDHVLIIGDLFDFWFEYRTVIPRFAFTTLAVLLGLRDAGVRITVVGGNHDRWGGPFWEREVGATFHRYSANLDLGGLPAHVEHGDGVATAGVLSKVLRFVVHRPVTAAAVRAVHPDVALAAVSRFSQWLARSGGRQARLDREGVAQAQWAREWLAGWPEVQLLVLGHTHRPALETVAPRRWYLNPGAWQAGRCYAVIGEEGPALRRFE